MFNSAIDSKFRGCDVVAIRVEDVAASASPARTSNPAWHGEAGRLAILKLMTKFKPGRQFHDEIARPGSPQSFVHSPIGNSTNTSQPGPATRA